ncbi:MAG: hypothetical protein VX733_09910 [Candidatus Latescibacterota bacterium]|nr:hypothetical protein [Candidatus Latescibacterota bacterium]
MQRLQIAALLFTVAGMMAACSSGGEEPIVLKIFPAKHDPDPKGEVPAGWERVQFQGSHRSHAGVFLVAAEPLLTDWNVTAMRISKEPDHSRAIHFRLNGFGQRKMAEYCAKEANLKAPLALKIDGRWVDFSPILRPVVDRMTVYGLTIAEAQHLDQQVQNR